METETVRVFFKDGSNLPIKVVRGTQLFPQYSDAFKIIDYEGDQLLFNFREVKYISLEQRKK